MKHIFIINPKAGKGQGEKYIETIIEKALRLRIDYEIFVTEEVGHGEMKVRETCEKFPKENFRFYALGGDGTLNEVVNGAFGYKNAEIANIPIGSGNDFIRNFVRSGDFMSIESQILGKASKIDLMSVKGVIDGVFSTRYAINMFNVGFDASIADDMNKFKNLKGVSGGIAYRLSVGLNFLAKKTWDITVIGDGEPVHSGKLLFVNICNGCFLGGGMKGAPMAVVDDGKVDMNVIKDISRKKIANLLPKYMKGTHMLEEGIEKTIIYKQCKNVAIVPNCKEVKLGIDGEIYSGESSLEFEVIPKAVKFVIPGTVE